MSDERTRNRAAFRELATLLTGSARVVALTGAGISTESGIPDYRGPNGVWAQRRIPRIEDVRTDPAAQAAYWRERRERFPEMLARQPNAGHLALARLEQRGKLRAVITQNIDGLHQKAGNDPATVYELHGSTLRVRCLNCGRIYESTDMQRILEADEEVPVCPVCGGPLRSATILFGEPLPRNVLTAAATAARQSDLMLVVGSSLVVNPAAQLPRLTRDAGGAVAIINRTPTPLDRDADLVLRTGAGATLDALTRRVLDGESGLELPDEALVTPEGATG
jgi:NAD-dependent deacetylase